MGEVASKGTGSRCCGGTVRVSAYSPSTWGRAASSGRPPPGPRRRRRRPKVIAGSAVLHGDDTPIPVLAPGTGKTRTGLPFTEGLLPLGDTPRSEAPTCPTARPTALRLPARKRENVSPRNLFERQQALACTRQALALDRLGQSVSEASTGSSVHSSPAPSAPSQPSRPRRRCR